MLVELKLPNVGLLTLEARAAFTQPAAEIVDKLTVAEHTRHDTRAHLLA